MISSMIPDIREDKLPVWARDKLRELRNKLEECSGLLSLAREEALRKGCTGKVTAEGIMREGFPLHDRAVVTFRLPNGKIDVMLRENGTLLDLNSSGAMLVRPQASNSVHIQIGERI